MEQVLIHKQDASIAQRLPNIFMENIISNCQGLLVNKGRLGTFVSRKSLRKGDLMFFYVPGRFKTNKTVGHVGIYIGNYQIYDPCVSKTFRWGSNYEHQQTVLEENVS